MSNPPNADGYSEYVRALAAAPTLPGLPQPTAPTREVPPNPPGEIQQKFVGAAYQDAYTEAERFVDASRELSGSLAARTVLDFGSGWGRISRMLLREVPPAQLWASDVDPEMTALVNVTLPGINAVTNAPMPPSSFRDGMFDAVFAFSVFSHLSEDAHARWAAEFARVCRPGAQVFFTVLEQDFLGQIAGAQAAVAAGVADGFATSLAQVVPDANKAAEAFRNGEFIYGGGSADGVRTDDFYGWAAAPRPWIERVWGGLGFRIERWIPTGELFQQALVSLVYDGTASQSTAQPGRKWFGRRN